MLGEVYVLGAAMLPMGKYPQSSYVGLAAPAARHALRIANLRPKDVDAVYCGHAFGGMLTAQRICQDLGVGHVPMVNVDNACSGGATALHEACTKVASGRAQIALVIGVEKLSQFGGGMLPLVQEDWEVRQGMVMPAMYAMRAQRLLYERKAADLKDLAAVSVKARRHAASNPFARYRDPITITEVLSSRAVAEPLTLLMCCPNADGAAAVIVASAEGRARSAQDVAMKVSASVLHSGTFEAGFRNMLHPEITYSTARQAFEEAGMEPRDLDVVELHDAFAVAEILYYEALGLCDEGEGIRFLREGRSTYGGDVVVNPSGGLLAKGHPVGASGVAQVVEMFWQLTSTAEGRQVAGARVGLTHVTGGGIAGLDHGACCIHIFERCA